MRKIFLATCIAMISCASYSQQGTNQVDIGADLGLPLGDFASGFSFGFGGYVKILYGVGKAGQFTFTTGYTSFFSKQAYREAQIFPLDKATVSIIPLLIGYRQNLNGIYIEPQLGYGSYGAHISYQGQSGSGSTGAFTYALGIGVAHNGLDVGIRYQAGTKEGGTTSLMGLRIGYNFSLAVGKNK